MSINKKILIVSAFFPYPTHFGGAFDIWEKIKGFYKLKFEIHLIYTSKEYPKEQDLQKVQKFVQKIYFVRRKNNFSGIFSVKPTQIKSREKLNQIKLESSYFMTVLESEYVSLVLDNKTLKSENFVLRVHNNEAKYFKELFKSTSNIFRKAYYLVESIKFKRISKKIYTKMDRLWFISSDELMSYSSIKSNGIHLPPPINQKFINRKLTDHNVLFIGSLYMDNNIEGLLWYLKNVHVKLIDEVPNYRLIICGSTGQQSEVYFEKIFSKYSNIDLFFNIDNLEPIYKSATVFVNPMLHGSGVKVKSINALANGLPLVSTKTGSEGIGLKDKEMFLLANTTNEFEAAIMKIFNSEHKEKMVKNAQEYLKSLNYLDIVQSEIDLLNEKE